MDSFFGFAPDARSEAAAARAIPANRALAALEPLLPPPPAPTPPPPAPLVVELLLAGKYIAPDEVPALLAAGVPPRSFRRHRPWGCRRGRVRRS